MITYDYFKISIHHLIIIQDDYFWNYKSIINCRLEKVERLEKQMQVLTSDLELFVFGAFCLRSLGVLNVYLNEAC